MADVCVIGAGPAGSTFAARMAQLGHRVHLIERQRFPRRNLGESLSPGVMTLLRAADMHETIEAAGFPAVKGVRVKWPNGPKLREDTGAKGMLVDRGEFDLRLLDRAQAFGVEVHQPAMVRQQIWDGARWRLRIDIDGIAKVLDADFVADASGRRSAPGRQMRPDASTLAVYGYWRGAALPELPRIEAGQDGWYWGVPLPDGTYNTLVFVDPVWFRSAPGSTMSERFLKLINRSGLMQDCRDVELIAPVRALNATSYLSRDCVAPTRIQLGDAALAIDPISSSGVQKAIQSALSGAIVANTMLRRPESTDAALDFYRAQLSDASERHRRWTSKHYRVVADACDRPFWRQRSTTHAETDAPPLPAIDAHALAATPVELSSELEFISMPCLRGDFVSVAAALHHPRLTNPLVFLGGRELAPLLQTLPSGKTQVQIAQSWLNHMPLESGMAIAGWLVKHGILVGQSYNGGAPP
jgi:2-polyprenyl-6-methoxyphenol hydroxylase-like FAD-dependent oxidoreductase